MAGVLRKANAGLWCGSPTRASGRVLRPRRAASRKPRTKFARFTPTTCADAPSQENHTRRAAMRFMVIVKATKGSEAGKMPSEEMLAAMAKFNEELVKAGVMLDGAGLKPTSQ